MQAAPKGKSAVKNAVKCVVLLGVLQHPKKYAVDGLGGGFIVAGQGVAVDAEGVHVLAVSHQLLDFPGGQRLDYRHKGVP